MCCFCVHCAQAADNATARLSKDPKAGKNSVGKPFWRFKAYAFIFVYSGYCCGPIAAALRTVLILFPRGKTPRSDSCSDRGDLRAGVKRRLVYGFCLGHRRGRDTRRLDRVLLMLLFHALLLPFPAQRPVESIIPQFNGERCCFKICLNRSVAPSSAGRPAHMLSRSGKTEDRRAEQSRDRSLRTEVIFWELLFRACSLGKSELKGAEGQLGAFGVRVELRKQPRIELCEARFPFVHIRVLLPSKVFDPMLR